MGAKEHPYALVVRDIGALDEKRRWQTERVDEPSKDRSDRDDAIAGVLLVLLLLSPLFAPISTVFDIVTVVVAGLGLAWLVYARMRRSQT